MPNQPTAASPVLLSNPALELHRQLEFLRRCYQFVNQDWQHALREALPDQGFEMRFREACVTRLPDWSISMSWELRLGEGLDTASGVAHEVDIVARCDVLRAVLEIKNRPNSPPEKNDIIIFFAKLLDYGASRCGGTILQRVSREVHRSNTPPELNSTEGGLLQGRPDDDDALPVRHAVEWMLAAVGRRNVIVSAAPRRSYHRLLV